MCAQSEESRSAKSYSSHSTSNCLCASKEEASVLHIIGCIVVYNLPYPVRISHLPISSIGWSEIAIGKVDSVVG